MDAFVMLFIRAAKLAVPAMDSMLSRLDRFRLPARVDRLVVAALAIIPLAYFVLMVIGLVRWYTPVPFWDMWDGYLTGYIRYLDGHTRELFAQANEHRIWFANILFYLDLAFFGGRSLFLVPVNGLLAVAVWLTLSLIARHLLKDRPGLWPLVALGLSPLCFSWLQEQNLSWGFQSQFFVAYLFPLAAFACLALSYSAPRSRTWFACAALFGLASMGTMANGLLALPLLLVMILVMPRPSWVRAGIVLGLGAVATFLWFQGYYTIDRPRADPSQFSTFVLTFFGLPVVAMLEHRAPDFTTAALAYVKYSKVVGALFIVASAGFAVRWVWRRGKADPMELALITFLVYVGASCVGIASGRATIQPNAALVGRYATPALIAWGVMIILVIHAFRKIPFARTAVVVTAVIGAFGFLPAQRRVFSDEGPATAHYKMVGALALKMRVPDWSSVSQIYPTDGPENIKHIRLVADMAEKKQMSIMGDPALAAAAASIGKPVSAGFRPCEGSVDQTEVIPTADDYRRITGWAFDMRTGTVPPFAYVAADGVIEGVAATGFVRHDVAAVMGDNAREGGFTAFVRTPAATGADLKIYCAV
jgi:hypothetical protein